MEELGVIGAGPTTPGTRHPPPARGPGPAPGLLLPSGPGRTRCQGPTVTSHPEQDQVHPGPFRAAHRDGPLAQPPAHDAAFTAAAKSSRRCRQILPPPPPSSGAALRHTECHPPARRFYWLSSAVRRKRPCVPHRDAAGRRHSGDGAAGGGVAGPHRPALGRAGAGAAGAAGGGFASRRGAAGLRPAPVRRGRSGPGVGQ